MSGKKQERYFEIFVKMSAISCAAAKLLREILIDYDPEKHGEYMEKMHMIEHEGDESRHSMVKLLSREFITPIEREDIMAIGNAIDTVTDKIEDVLQKMYMYNIRKVREDAVKGVETIISCVEALNTTLEEFHNYKKLKTIKGSIVEINRLEEVGDQFYIQATRRVFTDTDVTPLEAFSWSHIYHYMEDVLDTCEDAADVIEDVIMKNS